MEYRRPAPQHAGGQRLGDFAILSGYDLPSSPPTVAPGDAFTVTLFYHVSQTPGQNYIRFLQLYDPAQGMAAQFDGPPADGDNPTWSWQPGEFVTDRVMLHVATDATPGAYRLFLGFYSLDDAAHRLDLSSPTGERLADNWIPLGVMEVAKP